MEQIKQIAAEMATPAADRPTTAAERLDGWSRGDARIMASGYGPFTLGFNRDIQEVVEAASMRGFLTRLRGLFNIEGWRLPVPVERRAGFMHDPARYLIHADDEQASAIWRETEKCQGEL